MIAIPHTQAELPDATSFAGLTEAFKSKLYDEPLTSSADSKLRMIVLGAVSSGVTSIFNVLASPGCNSTISALVILTTHPSGPTAVIR